MLNKNKIFSNLDSEYCFPPMDFKVSKLVNDSKWKTGQGIFVMQLKIKYFVYDIGTLRLKDLRKFQSKKKFSVLFLDIFLLNIFSIYNFDKCFLLIHIN